MIAWTAWQLVVMTLIGYISFSGYYANAAAQLEIPIGLLIAVTGISTTNPTAPSPIAAEVGIAALMAIADVNRYTDANGNATLLEEAAALAPVDLSYLDQPFNLIGIVNDSSSQPSEGLVAALLQLQEFHVSGVIGTTFSSVCESIGVLMSLFSVPIVSYACTAAALSDRTTYSTFFRTVSSDTLQAHALAWLVSSYGWANIAVISTEDAYAFGIAEEFQTIAPTLGINVLTAAVFTYNSQYHNAEQAVVQVLNSGARIILITAIDNDALHVFTAAAKYGLLSDDYVWMGPDGLNGVGTFAGNTTLAAMTRGLIVTAPFNGFGLPQYTKFLQKWANATADQFPQLAGVITQSIFTKTPTSHCGQAYDAALMYAVAANRIIKQQIILGLTPQVNATFLTAEFQKSDFNFTGVSGQLTFNNGDRLSNYLVNQLSEDGSTFINLGIIGTTGPVSSSLISSTVFHSGTNIIPADLPPPIPKIEVKVSDSAIITVNVFMAIETVWVLCCIAFTIRHSSRYVVKASSPVFLLVICLGVLVGLVAIPLMSVNSDALCRSYPFVIGLSVVIIFAALFLKTNRIALIFSHKFALHTQHLRDGILLYYVLLVVLLECAFNLCWALISPDSQHQLSAGASNEYFIGCGGGTDYKNWLIASYAYKGAALLWGVRLAVQVRSVYTPFNESKYVISCILAMAFSCAVLPPAFYTSHDPTVRFVLECLWILVIGAYIPTAMFLPKMIHVFFQKDRPGHHSDMAYQNSHDGKPVHSSGIRTPHEGISVHRKIAGGKNSGIRIISQDQLAAPGDSFSQDAADEMVQIVKQMDAIMKKNDLANMQFAIFQAIRVAGMIYAPQVPAAKDDQARKNSVIAKQPIDRQQAKAQTNRELENRKSVTVSRAIELARPTAASADSSAAAATNAASTLKVTPATESTPATLGPLSEAVNETSQIPAKAIEPAGSAQSTQRFSASADTNDNEMKSRGSTVTLHHDAAYATSARNFV